jgi:glycosyltransferase involved in cell wall biosynthesis
MPKSSILFLDQYSGISGGQKVLLNIIQGFSKKGYRCLAALPERGLLSQNLDQSGIECKFLPIGYYSITQKNLFDFINYAARLPFLVFLLIKLIKKQKINVVYANGSRTFIWATIACSIAGVPLIWHIHSIFKEGLAKKICSFFGKFGVVKKIFAVSNAAADSLNELKPKLQVIYNAVADVLASTDICLLKREYNLAEDNFLVGNIGILEEWKNQEDLLRAARYIKDSGKIGIYFFIIGDSLYKEPGKQRYKKRLEELVSETGLEKEIIFTGFRSDIDKVMRSLDILVICSKDPDPCPLVSLEAASRGLAIISTDLGGTKEIFKENEEAFFYKSGDFKELANKILHFYEYRQLMHAMAEAARKKVIKEHNLDGYLERITNTVEKTIHGD